MATCIRIHLPAKVTDAQTLRNIALEGHRFTPQEALESRLVDHIVPGDTEAVLQKAQQVGEAVAGHARSGAWGGIRVNPSIDLRSVSADVLAEGFVHRRGQRSSSRGRPEKRLVRRRRREVEVVGRARLR